MILSSRMALTSAWTVSNVGAGVSYERKAGPWHTTLQVICADAVDGRVVVEHVERVDEDVGVVHLGAGVVDHGHAEISSPSLRPVDVRGSPSERIVGAAPDHLAVWSQQAVRRPEGGRLTERDVAREWDRPSSHSEEVGGV